MFECRQEGQCFFNDCDFVCIEVQFAKLGVANEALQACDFVLVEVELLQTRHVAQTSAVSQLVLSEFQNRDLIVAQEVGARRDQVLVEKYFAE